MIETLEMTYWLWGASVPLVAGLIRLIIYWMGRAAL
jgi:hypothetical protein